MFTDPDDRFYVLVIYEWGGALRERGVPSGSGAGRGRPVRPERGGDIERDRGQHNQVLAIRMPADLLQREARSLDGRPLRAPFAVSGPIPASSPVLHVADFFIDVLERPGGLFDGRSLAARELECAFLAVLIENTPNNYRELVERHSGDVASAAHVRRAEEYIEAHLLEPFTLGDLAAVAGVIGRALKQAFVRYRGIPPLAVRREWRLNRARWQLERSVPGVSIGAVAWEHGYASASAFAKRYIERFGEAPRGTLRRSRARG